ncbi:signal peptidase I [Ammoniphilus oxalaticus]|uniref:Signal peptidase I n=1 Tax=Ammoniphilus oxalaticus TaxID=66863 RepID=A0A419SRD8_9BACL|nr:signal peptidase I [Ammoniphilus oxalaticus]RKD27098.1 signal peptidase I [Ammoniphilus oxalaticus]
MDTKNISKNEGKKEAWEWGKAIGIAVIIAFFTRTLLFSPYLVEGSSMESTLKNHDKVLVNKAIYLVSKPKHGDVIVLHATQENDYIKRVIGVPGDKIEVRDDTLYINDRTVEEKYLSENKNNAAVKPLTEDIRPLVVPEGKVYVLGDNRQNSLDSSELGPFDIDKVVGRAEFVLWPFKDIRLIK